MNEPPQELSIQPSHSPEAAPATQAATQSLPSTWSTGGIWAQVKHHAIVQWTVAFVAVAYALLHGAGVLASSLGGSRGLPASVHLYVFDCGTLHIGDLSRFRLSSSEVATSDLSVACFLVAHPKGTLMWDPGAVPDGDWTPTGAPVEHKVDLPKPEEKGFGRLVMRKGLSNQLAEIGYAASDINFLALSHYHYDHTANANAFASATWLVRPEERDAMFSNPSPGVTQPSTYAALRNSKTVLIKTDDYDIFGDGTVILKFAPGHTPGHQVLFVKLANTGAVVLSGDLYHYSEARALGRLPTFNFDQAASADSRAAIEAFLKGSGAALWIQHDFVSNAKLRKAPEYYE